MAKLGMGQYVKQINNIEDFTKLTSSISGKTGKLGSRRISHNAPDQSNTKGSCSFKELVHQFNEIKNNLPPRNERSDDENQLIDQARMNLLYLDNKTSKGKGIFKVLNSISRALGDILESVNSKLSKDFRKESSQYFKDQLSFNDPSIIYKGFKSISSSSKKSIEAQTNLLKAISKDPETTNLWINEGIELLPDDFKEKVITNLILNPLKDKDSNIASKNLSQKSIRTHINEKFISESDNADIKNYENRLFTVLEKLLASINPKTINISSELKNLKSIFENEVESSTTNQLNIPPPTDIPPPLGPPPPLENESTKTTESSSIVSSQEPKKAGTSFSTSSEYESSTESAQQKRAESFKDIPSDFFNSEESAASFKQESSSTSDYESSSTSSSQQSEIPSSYEYESSTESTSNQDQETFIPPPPTDTVPPPFYESSDPVSSGESFIPTDSITSESIKSNEQTSTKSSQSKSTESYNEYTNSSDSYIPSSSSESSIDTYGGIEILEFVDLPDNKKASHILKLFNKNSDIYDIDDALDLILNLEPLEFFNLVKSIENNIDRKELLLSFHESVIEPLHRSSDTPVNIEDLKKCFEDYVQYQDEMAQRFDILLKSMVYQTPLEGKLSIYSEYASKAKDKTIIAQNSFSNFEQFISKLNEVNYNPTEDIINLYHYICEMPSHELEQILFDINYLSNLDNPADTIGKIQAVKYQTTILDLAYSLIIEPISDEKITISLDDEYFNENTLKDLEYEFKNLGYRHTENLQMLYKTLIHSINPQVYTESYSRLEPLRYLIPNAPDAYEEEDSWDESSSDTTQHKTIPTPPEPPPINTNTSNSTKQPSLLDQIKKPNFTLKKINKTPKTKLKSDRTMKDVLGENIDKFRQDDSSSSEGGSSSNSWGTESD